MSPYKASKASAKPMFFANASTPMKQIARAVLILMSAQTVMAPGMAQVTADPNAPAGRRPLCANSTQRRAGGQHIAQQHVGRVAQRVFDLQRRRRWFGIQ